MSNENNFNQFLPKKAYEISYALFRLAMVVKRPSFADHLENKGIALLSATISEDYMSAKIVARGIEYLLQFGADVGVIREENTRVIIGELQMFYSAIAESEKSAKPTMINLENMFSKFPVSVVNGNNSIDVILPREEKEGVILRDRNDAHGTNGFEINGNGNGGNIVKVAMRQSAILERIRQNGNCRLKEIQDILPDMSERTIRYDIQNLLEQGLVERIGNGGPATFYRMRG